MNALALILARAGSAGVPGKNRADVAGRPCFMWSVDDARAAAGVGRVAVSTDDQRIIDRCVQIGVDSIARPPDLATDTAAVDDAARHAVGALGDPAIDSVVILYANVPVRPAGLIDRALERLVSAGADSVQSYAPVGKFHPWWTARIDEATGAVRPWEGDTLNHGVHRRQDLPPAHIPDGGVLVVTRRALMLEIPGVASGPHAFLGADRRGVTTRPGEVVDIDTPIDVLVADLILRERHAAGRGAIPAPSGGRCAP
ncbi:MAG: acylneuraminate cytidylyltransferase family protein [Planctomycetota bacterium]|nr:MAG: acylneuraminate cytidylyltransferase family protein [Planctomycetota bacterium]